MRPSPASSRRAMLEVVGATAEQVGLDHADVLQPIVDRQRERSGGHRHEHVQVRVGQPRREQKGLEQQPLRDESVQRWQSRDREDTEPLKLRKNRGRNEPSHADGGPTKSGELFVHLVERRDAIGTDARGRQVIVAANKISFIEVGESAERRVGFASL